MQLIWYFDVISPFAYLQWMDLRQQVDIPAIQPKPILFAGLLGHYGNKGPAEIPSKRAYTYRYITWLAKELDVPFRFPDAHPFNPLPLLRLCIAAQNTSDAVDKVFNYIWRDGLLPDNEAAMNQLAERLNISDWMHEIKKENHKAALKANTAEALERGVFGVPTLWADGHLFWGQDSSEMFLDYLRNPQLFDAEEMQRVSSLPAAKQRKEISSETT